MELALQKYLRSGKTMGQLFSEYKIKCIQHSTYKNLILFKYGIDTPMSERICQECRGIILDESKNWSIVSYTYDKFFNHYEGFAAEIDWSTAKVMEKLDGSLMQVFWYDNTWNVASSGLPDAVGQVNDFGFTFKELFWQTWKNLGYDFPKDKNCCYAFELITKYNRIVCQYSEPRIVLHGVRDLTTLHELEPEPVALANGWQVVRSFPLQTLKDVIEVAKTLDPLQNEGYVVKDSTYNRAKIKSPAYLALAHMKDGFSSKRMVELVRLNEGSEFLGYFPEFTDLYNEVKSKYEDLVTKIANVFSYYSPIIAQKDFALAVKHLPYSGILFQMRKTPGKTVKELLSEARLEYVVDLLKG